MAEYDAVIVGSGVNSLACGALLARERMARLRARAQRLARRRDPHGRDHRAGFPPRRLQRVASALGRRRCARAARRRSGGARARVPQHRPADGDGVPRRCVPRSCCATLPGNASELGAGVAGRARAVLPERRSRVRRARHRAVVGRRPRVRRRRRCGGSDAAGLAAFTGDLLQTSRDWLESTFASERAHGLLAPWVLHTGLGPDAAASGFMTQVIAVAVQEGGMPIPRGGGARLADALVQLIRDHGGVCETGQDVERVLVRQGRAVGVRLAGGETVDRGARGDRERHADAALRAAARRERGAGVGHRGSAALPLRPRGDADPFRALRAGALGGRRAARPHGDRPRHAGARRRLARGERGGTWTAARRGDGRRRAAADDRPVACARRQGHPLDPAPGAAARREGRRRR